MAPHQTSIAAQDVRELPLFEVHLAQLESFSFVSQNISNLLFTSRRNAQLNQAQAGVKSSYRADPFVGFEDETKQVDVGWRNDEVLFRTSFWLPLQGFPLLFHQSLWYQMSWQEGKRGVLKRRFSELRG